jgi:hypothetical protein
MQQKMRFFTLITLLSSTAVALLGFYYIPGKQKESAKPALPSLFKQIDPNAEQSEYLELAKTFTENDLKAVDCVDYLMTTKRQQAEDAIKKEWNISDKAWANVAELLAELDTLDTQKSKTKKQTVNVDSEIPSFVKDQIFEVTAQNEIQHDLDIRCIGKGNNIAVEREFELKPTIDHEQEKIRVTYRELKPFTWCIGDFIPEDQQQHIRAVIEHENEHMRRQHTAERYFVYLASLIGNKTHSYEEFDNSASGLKLRRLHEIEADVYPALRSDLTMAESIYNLKKFRESERATQYTKKTTHPLFQTRTAWAGRIFKLRQAEDQLNNGVQLA